MKKKLEIACFNKKSASLAQSAGADRIEFSQNYQVGGLSPSEPLILEIRAEIELPLHILIRPRAGNFIYTKEELAQMKKSIEFCRENKVQGVVLGVLTNEGSINTEACKAMIQSAMPMKLCFHRALDACINKNQAFEQLIELGFDAVLTSGGERDAVSGFKNLMVWQEKFGKKISIIPGGSLRSSNLSQVLETNCEYYHSSAIIDSSEMASETEIKKMKCILIP